jgi:hypothetical protein
MQPGENEDVMYGKEGKQRAHLSSNPEHRRQYFDLILTVLLIVSAEGKKTIQHLRNTFTKAVAKQLASKSFYLRRQNFTCIYKFYSSG